MLQGGIRCNTYVGLAAGAFLFGQLAIMGLVVFVVVTTVNVVSVVALTHYGRQRAARPRDVLASVARNPLIVACVLGFGGNALGIELPAIAYETLDVLARASLTLGLLCVGAGLGSPTSAARAPRWSRRHSSCSCCRAPPPLPAGCSASTR